jgi:hypothetical protein
MALPALEVADILRDHGPAWREANRAHVSLEQLKVMNAIERCRTAALGGHVARCENAACGHTVVVWLATAFPRKRPSLASQKRCVWPDAHDSNSQTEGRIMRYELADYEWAAIKPMLPNKPRGVPRVNDRRVLNGIFWVLRSGAPWRDLPEAFGPYTTCYNRFVRWRRAGV